MGKGKEGTCKLAKSMKSSTRWDHTRLPSQIACSARAEGDVMQQSTCHLWISDTVLNSGNRKQLADAMPVCDVSAGCCQT